MKMSVKLSIWEVGIQFVSPDTENRELKSYEYQ